MLIQDIKNLLHHTNVTVSHILRDGNQCTVFMAKLETYSDIDLLHESPLLAAGLDNLLRSDVADTLFFRE